MKQFLSHGASDQVLIEWQSLKLEEGEDIQRYVEKFWDLHLKATVYKRINFSEQKQQFCARLPEEWREYVNAQCSRTILEVIHHSMIASNIKFQHANKGAKSMFVKEKPQEKGRQSQGNNSNKSGKPKDKQGYQGLGLTLKDKVWDHGVTFLHAQFCLSVEGPHSWAAFSIAHVLQNHMIFQRQHLAEDKYVTYRLAWKVGFTKIFGTASQLWFDFLDTSQLSYKCNCECILFLGVASLLQGSNFVDPWYLMMC
ncbi:hypothetical protein L7F22_028125 [Adiantum nelumboides]|nr:hypothetical protein [Adiantum nelumboides]